MRSVVNSSQCVCHGVCDAEADVGICHSGDILSKRHALASVGVILNSLAKILRNQLDRFKIQNVCKLPGTLGGVAFNRVGQSIHSGGGSEALRHGGHHIRVDDSDIRDVVCIHTDKFPLLLNIGYDIVDGGLCTGAAGCRYSDGKYRAMLRRSNTLEGTDVCKLRVIDDNADALAGIHGGAAADGDHAVGTAVLKSLNAVLNILNGRVRLDVIIQEEIDTVLLQKIRYLAGYTKLHKIRIGCNEDLLVISCLDQSGNLLDCAMSMIRNSI